MEQDEQNLQLLFQFKSENSEFFCGISSA